MIFTLDVRRARKGDCLILHYGSEDDPGLVLIDGGPSNVYSPQLKPRLAEIRKARALSTDEPLLVDLMMVSHIDDDHINGILELTKELVAAAQVKKPALLKIRSLWHNSFDDIIGNDPKELVNTVKASFGPASLESDVEVEGLDHQAAKVLASVAQGFQLRDDAKKLKLAINREFGGELVLAEKKDPLDFGKGLRFTVAGPMKPEVIALQKEHDAFLKKAAGKKTTAALASFTDTSVPNLSSLVLLAEVNDRRILLTGDARGDKILEGLEKVKLLKPKGKMHVDILKAPHHGSDRNIDPPFFERIEADHYVFSGNGEHGNPERDTLRMLLDARGDADFTVHLTYPIAEIDVARKAEFEKEQAKKKGKNKPEKWSAKKHSLAALFSANPAFAKKVRIVPEGAPHVIDLHNKLGF